MRLYTGGFLVCVVAILCCSGQPRTAAVGIVSLCADGEKFRYYLEEETRTIPRDLREWQGFGFLLQFPNDVPRTVTARYRLPDVPTRLGESWTRRGYSVADAVSGLETDPVEVRSGRWFSNGLDADDPLGVYEVDVLIDGKLFETLEFQVVEGGSGSHDTEGPPDCPKPSA